MWSLWTEDPQYARYLEIYLSIPAENKNNLLVFISLFQNIKSLGTTQKGQRRL